MNPVIVVCILVAVFLVARAIRGKRSLVTPGSAAAAVEKGAAVLVDVREPAEWATGVAQPAVLLPLSDLRGDRKRWAPFLEQNRGKRILLYCRSGNRSGMAAATLKEEGFDAANVGALSDWQSAGLPVRIP